VKPVFQDECQYLAVVKLKNSIFQITLVNLNTFGFEDFKLEGLTTIF